MGPVRVGGDVVGGASSQAGAIVSGGPLAAVTVGGSVRGGTAGRTGTIRSDGAIGAVLVRGSLLGNAGNPVIISARGQAVPAGAADVAIGRLTVLGRVEFGLVRAGVDASGTARNADAQVGPVVVGGDWVASSIAAGAVPGANGFFGDADDARMAGVLVKDDPLVASRIASLTVGGRVTGTAGGADHYGLVAEVVGAVTVEGTALPLTAGPGNDDVPVGVTGDFRVNEI
jgi:hypothetical protein